MQHVIRKIFDKTIYVVFSVILLFLVIGMAIGAFQLFANLVELIKFKGITGKYIDIFTDVLTLFVLVELSRSLIEYFDSNKLKLAFIIDAAIVFILRELMISLFKHQAEPQLIYSLSLLLFVLGAMRIASIIVFDKEKKMLLMTKDKHKT